MKFKDVIWLVGLNLLLLCLPASAQVRISEFMASNTQTLADEDGSFEDWIEIQNTSPATVNLLDWCLTDKSGNLTKWRFPATNLPPGGFIVVFASNKDRRTPGAPLHTNFKLSAAGGYLALVDPTGTNIVTQFAPEYPPQVPDVSFGFALTASNVTLVTTGATARVLVPSVANGGSGLSYLWTGASGNEPFNTASWTSGQTGIGFGVAGVGLNVQSAMLNSNASAFVRIPFVIDSPTNYSLLTLNLKYDDGYVAWLNGVAIARANAPIEDLDWNSSALGTHSSSGFETLALDNASALLRAGTNILAIQGLNVSAADASFLVLPELVGTTIAGENTSGLYFTQPTPGTENLGGATVPGPGITSVQHAPNVPLDNDNLVVTARVFPTAAPVFSVALHYRVMFDSEVQIAMADDGAHGDGSAGDGVYGATIPASASSTGQMVRYYITASDVSNTVSRLPVFSDPAATAEYFGTVVNPNYVTSALPVIQLFAPPSVLQPGPTTSQTGADSQTGGRVSLYYNEEFYDNISMNLRGNTTAGFAKKSHRLNFNKEHPFRYSDSAKRIRKTSFIADYPDPSYMRQGMSFWLDDQLGAPPPFCIPVRLQLNGAFYELATHSDVQETEMLERIGYDPNGAYYANVGTAQPGGYSTGGFEKKTRLWETNNDDYNALINALAPALPIGQKLTNLLDRLDLPEVISYMAAARFTHQNDDVWAGMAMYHDNDGDDLWRILPYDQNLSWGAAWMDAPDYAGIQVTNDNLKSFPMYGSSQAIPANGGGWNGMYDLIFQVPQTREMFLRRTRTLLDTYILPPGTPAGVAPVEQKIIQWRDLIAAEAQLDRAWWGWPALGGQCNFNPGVNLTDGVAALLTEFIGNRRNHFYGKHSVTNTALPIGISKTSNAGIPLAQPANAALEIAGWDYNPASANQDEEYLQLTNANSFAVDISGWELDGGIHFKFKGGTVVPAKSSIFVSPDVKAFRARAVSPRGGEARFVVGPYRGHLNAWGESFTLTNSTGSLVSSNGFAGNPSPAQRYLRITEIMYNPSAAPAITNDAQQFEYAELKNISTNVTLNLNGVRFTNEICFNFTGSAVTSLAPGQTVLLVRNAAAFSARYGSGYNIAGQFIGALDNGGETLRLEDAVGEKILEFAYHDGWYPITDGLGFSLVIVDENAAWNTWGQKASWRASGNVNGSPCGTDPAAPEFSPIVINEALTHTDLPQVDSVELFNPNTNAVNIGGWFLTDDFFTPKKYRIANGTMIAANSYLVITENEFNTGANAFRLSELGEDIYLFSANATTNLSGFYNGYSFSAAPNGVSFGRYTNSQGDVDFILQSAITLGASNAYPRVGPIVLSEIMYHPPDTNGVDNDLDEFIEFQNIASTNVPLYDPHAVTNTWHLRNAVDFDWPMNVTLAAGARCLVVGFNPTNTAQLAAFRARYGISNNLAVYGPWLGKLDNSGETLELKQPGAPDDTAIVPYYMIDKIAFTDQTPWPVGADGIGNSLQRRSNTGYGNDPTNWFAAGITAGRATIPNTAPTVVIVSPNNGAISGSTNGVIVSVSASDSDGSIALVQLFGDGYELARWTAGSSNYLWAAASAGVHQLKARVTDNLGAVAESTVVSVTIVTPPPTVAIASPTNGTVVVSGSSVLLTANAASGGGAAATVDYFLDGALIGSAAFPFSLSWTANPGGYHVLSAVAHDSQGQTSESSAISIFVQATSFNPVLIPAGANWRYLADGSDQGTNWIPSAFVDNGWPTGAAKFGFNSTGNSGITTVLGYGADSNNKYVTYYFRQTFVVPTLADMTNLFLEVQRDDGVAVYLNGVPFYRNNLPSGTLTNLQLAANAGDNGNNWQTAMLPLANLVAGTNILAAEVHQSSRRSSDLGFDLRLTLLGTVLGPAITAQPQSLSRTNGQTASFTVTTTGSGPLAYQWKHSGTNLAGTATNSLTIANVSNLSAGDYQVVVANSVGAATSAVATLTIIRSDTDDDGMPDDWEVANGTNPLVNDRNVDPDGDGLGNFDEYLAGTSPTNAASTLKFESLSLAGSNLVLSFVAISNRSYTVQIQSVPGGGGGWQKWLDVDMATSNRTAWLTNGLSANTNRFYRLVTPLQP